MFSPTVFGHFASKMSKGIDFKKIAKFQKFKNCLQDV